MSLDRHWQRITPVSALLLPLALVFRAVVALRRALYTAGILSSSRLPVPVVVVGNITAGGTGKTPLVLWLARLLRERGRRPGIVSRGYGGRATAPTAVDADADPALCGDEPVLLAQRSDCPVWVAPDRTAAARALLAAHPECDVILCDDGLQHYKLARDVEIAVVDGDRGAGNGWLLPAGPLREPASRLDAVDAVVVNGGGTGAAGRPALAMHLQPRAFINVMNPGHRVYPEHFLNQRVHAIAGIGNPGRFFAQLQHLGLTFVAHPFPDHHPYRAADLAFDDADAIVMTEKDAVKCRRFATDKHWALRVEAEVDPALADIVLDRIGTPATP